MDRPHGEQAASLAQTFCYRRLKLGFLWGVVAAVLLLATDARPDVFAITALGDIVLLGALIALAAILAMARNLFRGVSHGVTQPSFWTAAGFMSAVSIGALLNMVAL